MKKLRPYIEYLQINFKIYLLVWIAFLAFISIISIGDRVLSGASKIDLLSSTTIGSLTGIIFVYAITLSNFEFNTMLNIRSDRKSIIISSIISSIVFTLLVTILNVIFIKGLESIFNGFTLKTIEADISYILSSLKIFFLDISIGMVVGALIYRFGGIKFTLGLVFIGVIVILFGVSPNSILQAIMYKTIYYVEVTVENYSTIATILITLIMYTIYSMLMINAPSKEYSKKSIFKSKM